MENEIPTFVESEKSWFNFEKGIRMIPTLITNDPHENCTVHYQTHLGTRPCRLQSATYLQGEPYYIPLALKNLNA